MRKKKDLDQVKKEREKIEEIEDEIAEKNEQHRIYLEKSKKIEQKVIAMKKYEIFLETVRDKNIDDFDEIQAIVSRYQVLEGNNKNLHCD